MFQGQLSFVEAPPAITAPRGRKIDNFRRDAIKAAGGEAYVALLAKERAARARFRVAHPEMVREARRSWKKSNKRKFKVYLCHRARTRGRKRGLEATIKPGDLIWPTHCPVLGIKLDYPERQGERGGHVHRPDWPSLDRWDSTKGYVPGNVFVISLRANSLKSNATYEEILKVARYLSRRPRHG